MNNQTSEFVKIIKEICEEEGISLTSFSSDFMFCLKRNTITNYIFGYQFGLNSASAHMICEDKSTTSELLTYLGIPNVEHRCFMSPMNMKYVEAEGNWSNILSMLNQYGTVVLKDNKGTGGLSVYLARNVVELENAAQILFQSAHSIAVSPYYPILKEYRLILLDNDIKLIYHKERKHLTGDGKHTLRELYAKEVLQHHITCGLCKEDADKILKQGEIYPLHWKHNLGQGAVPVYDTEETIAFPLKELARKAAAAVGIRFASIDIIEIEKESKLNYHNDYNHNNNHIYLVLEINSGVMMEYLSQTDDKSRQIAKQIYKEAILKMVNYPF